MQEKEPRHPLDMTAEELRSLQQSDESLAAVRKAAKGEASTAGGGFFERDGLLYRRWIPPGRGGEDMATEQLVLPASCCSKPGTQDSPCRTHGTEENC